MPSGSSIPMIKTKVVSLKRPINVFTIPGIEIFNAGQGIPDSERRVWFGQDDKVALNLKTI